MFALMLADNQKPTADSPASPLANNLSPLILIVEDDEDSRLMLKILLETWNYRVLEADDGIKAVAVAERTRPDLILMDIKLPHLDGFETTRRIRQSPMIKDVPIIFLSGCAEAVYRRLASAVGASEFLVKPLIFEELEVFLEKYVRQAAQIRAA